MKKKASPWKRQESVRHIPKKLREEKGSGRGSWWLPEAGETAAAHQARFYGAARALVPVSSSRLDV